jgi:hypothetical protein
VDAETIGTRDREKNRGENNEGKEYKRNNTNKNTDKNIRRERDESIGKGKDAKGKRKKARGGMKKDVSKNGWEKDNPRKAILFRPSGPSLSMQSLRTAKKKVRT